MKNTCVSCVVVAVVGFVMLGRVSLPMAVAQVEPLRLVVAPGGDDTWSGTLRQANPTRSDGPFRSLERAG